MIKYVKNTIKTIFSKSTSPPEVTRFINMTTQVTDYEDLKDTETILGYLLHLRALEYQKQELIFINKKNEEIEHKFKEFLETQSLYYSFKELKYLTQYDLDYTGNAFWYFEKGGGFKPINYFYVPSKLVKIQNGRYDFIYNNIRYNVGIEDIIHFKTVTPESKVRDGIVMGVPILLNAARSVLGIEKAQKLNLKRYYDKDNTLPYIYTTQHNLGEKSIEEALDKFNSKMPANFKGISVLPPGVSLTPAATYKENPRQTPSEILEQLSTQFGFSLSYLYAKMQNRATAEVFQRDLFFRTVEPILDLHISKINNYIQTYLKINDIKVTYNVPDFDEPVITVNEQRAKKGWESIPEGDKYFVIPTGYQVIRTDNLLQNIPINDEQNNDIDGDKKFYANFIKNIQKKNTNLIKSLLFNYWKSWDNIEEKFANKFDKELKQAIENMFVMQLENKSTLADNISFELDIEYLLELLSKSINDYNETVIRQALQNIGVDYDVIVAGRAKNEALIELRKHFEKILKTISTTILDEVVIETSRDAILEKARLSIDSYFRNKENKSLVRTVVKAQTETTKKIVWHDAEFTRHWLTQRDGDVRPDHIEMDGQAEDEQGFFFIGNIRTPYPAGSGVASQDINCRCVTMPLKTKHLAMIIKYFKIIYNNN